MTEFLNLMIGDQVESTAEWRRQKAEQFPDDQRNVRAARELEQLAAEISRVGESELIHQQIVELHEKIDATDDCDDAWFKITETISEELRSIGFHSGYASGLELLEWYRDILQDRLDEILDPEPDLNEWVENDPAVKAAKQAYEEARAKAYAEALKRL